MDAYNAPAGSAWIGASKQELKLLMSNEKVLKTENVVLGGEPCTKETYANKNFYYNAQGQLIMIEVTKPLVKDALAGARDAYAKAYEVDVKKSKEKDITAGLQVITNNYLDDAMASYMFSDYNKASELFGKAAVASATAPLAQVDTTALYNAGFTAWMVKDYARAEEYFNKCIAADYYYEGGEVFAKLADIYANTDRKDNARDVLEKGFAKFPQSQSILIGLINYYLESKQSPDRLFELIGEAKKNEPTNASLYYVEGNIYNELGQKDKAVEAYYKCAEINPEYEFGFIGAGILYYNQALEIQDKAAAELDNAKYEALVAEFEEALLSALEPFERAFNVSKDNSLKVNVAEYLKNIYYRFSTKGPKYEEGYKKYNEIVKTGVIN
jgi:tetratricopeptide (TPR) repeat protein